MGKCRLWVNVAMGICRMGICRMGICRMGICLLTIQIDGISKRPQKRSKTQQLLEIWGFLEEHGRGTKLEE